METTKNVRKMGKKAKTGKGSSQELADFTKKEYAFGTSFFWLEVAGIFFLAFSLVYTIADLISRTGKAAFFMSLPNGVKIMVIGGFLFGAFMIFAAVTLMYTRGTKSLTKTVFAAERLYREQHTTRDAKIITAGLMISIPVIIVGIILAMFLTYHHPGSGSGSSTSSVFLDFIKSLSIGELLLLISSLYLVILNLLLLFAWLYNQGTIFFMRTFFRK
jgi:hypothetical protein